jgi:antitoxin (DNA-binding transcriptional repressor) of toxin-antitoxin stability system
MKRINIHQAKTHLSGILAGLKPGDKVLICNRNKPVAELHALPTAPRKPRPIGLEAGKFTVPPSFFEPLPDDLLDAFEGKEP